MAVYPIPAGRSSDSLLTQRLLSQLQAEQKRLLQVEQQLGTGRRVQLPSQDPSAAGRALALQQLLESKVQLETNLSTSQSYLSATDSALSGVADLLANARGLAVQAADSTTSPLEREALVLEIEATIEQMLAVGNHSFRGRYLFAGTDSTTRPFESAGEYIVYEGNDVAYRTLGEAGLFFENNLPGQELFGAVSAEVRGIDLNPVLTENTRLADLRGGLGVSTGSIVVSDGSRTSVVSLTQARTLQDVARLIEANPPEGRSVRVTIGARGLILELDDVGGGTLAVNDLPGGTTAAALGILRPQGTGGGPLVGDDLDPVLRPATQLADILGVRARALITSPGANNDLVVEFRERGAVGNNYRIQYVDDSLLQAAPGVSAGNEYAQLHTTAQRSRAGVRLSGVDNDLILTAVAPGPQWNNLSIEIDASQDRGNAAQVTFDATARVLRLGIDDTNETTLGTLVAAINASGYFTAGSDSSLGEGYDPASAVLATDAGIRGNTGNSGGAANTIYVHVEAGHTTANNVMAALRGNPVIDDLFDVRVDPLGTTSLTLAGSGVVDVAATGVTAGGTGVEWDQQSGLQITNGGNIYTIDLQDAKTVEDLLNALNVSDAGLLAEINQAGTGINVRSRVSGADFSIGENGGTTAGDLGLRTFSHGTLLTQLNYGEGVHAGSGTDFIIRRSDGVELAIDISTAATVGDVLDLINHHPDNLNPTTAVVARLALHGNGIELVDDNPPMGQSLTVVRGQSSYAAWELGLIPWGQQSSDPVSPPAQTASATLRLPPPLNVNTDLRISASASGTRWNGVAIEMRDTLSGNVAAATYDPVGRRLILDIDNGKTTANTAIAAILAEGTFTAALDTSRDPTNNGTGILVAPTGVAATTGGGTAEVLTGRDVNPQETEGVFNSLIRLRNAVATNDVESMQRIVEMLDADHDRLTFGRATLGTRTEGLEAIQARNQDDQVQLQSTLSNEIDMDLAEAITEFMARQAAYEASLRTIGNMFQLSLLDFL